MNSPGDESQAPASHRTRLLEALDKFLMLGEGIVAVFVGYLVYLYLTR